MDALTALTSVLTDGAFQADVNGSIVGSNAPFVQLLRRVPGDNWRNGVAEEDRALVDAYWDAIFLHPDDEHPAISFRVLGGDQRHQLRAHSVTNDQGEVTSAVGVVVLEELATAHKKYALDPSTGLPDRQAVFGRMDELQHDGRGFTLSVVVLEPEDAGDEIVRKEAARQLLGQVRPNDVLAGSLDGTFLVCAADLADDAAAKAFAERMSIALLASNIGARIGYSTPSGDAAPATLVREAEAGAYSVEPGEVGFAV